MSTKELLIKYDTLSREGSVLVKQWQLLKTNNVDESKIKLLEYEMKLLQEEKEHIAVRFIDEFLI